MNSINRKFGKLTTKSPADTGKVSVLLSDYEDADSTLAKIIEASKEWRDAWVSILTVQMAFVTSFDELYQPIVGTSDGHRDNPALTPRELLIRSSRLKQVCLELKTDLMTEVMMMDSRVIRPASDVRDYLQRVRKTIKKRETKRVEWERYIDKVNAASSKIGRSDKENAALAKLEEELARSSDAFTVVDDQLRQNLPPLIAAAFAILPHILGVQIMIQNSLLAQYYTIIHNYCEEARLPSPPPPTEEVIATWQRDFKPVQQEVEAINCIARGRAIHQSMTSSSTEDRGRKSSTLRVFSGLGSRRPSSDNASTGSISPNPEARLMRIPSSNPVAVSPPHPSPSPDPTSSYTPDFPSSHVTPTSSYSAHSAHAPAGPSADYFQRAAVAKKKPPPPPPPKRFNSDVLYATALYSFDGQSQGDLSFRENDRIRVIKKTDSTDDWWEGELRGMRGSFPANYCKIG